MERCIITGRRLPDAEVTITEEGPIACYLWGKREIKFQADGFARVPKDIQNLAEKAFGRPWLCAKAALLP